MREQAREKSQKQERGGEDIPRDMAAPPTAAGGECKEVRASSLRFWSLWDSRIFAFTVLYEAF